MDKYMQEDILDHCEHLLPIDWLLVIHKLNALKNSKKVGGNLKLLNKCRANLWLELHSQIVKGTFFFLMGLYRGLPT